MTEVTVNKSTGSTPEGEATPMSIEHQPSQSTPDINTGEALQTYLLNGQEVQMTTKQANMLGAQKIGHSGDLGLEAPAQGAVPITHEIHADDLAPTMPFNPKDKQQAREIQKKEGPNWFKRVVAGLTGAAVLGGGAYVGVKALGGSENDQPTDKKENVPGLVLGPDGEPLQYVEFSDEHDDRDNSGTPDNLTDSNNNGVSDSEELWDQENKEFVVPGTDKDAEILAGASQEDLNNIAEIETVFPEFWESNPHWKADFVQLDPLVKERVMVAVHSPEDYPGTDILTPEQQWEASVQDQFNRTPEDISN